MKHSIVVFVYDSLTKLAQKTPIKWEISESCWCCRPCSKAADGAGKAQRDHPEAAECSTLGLETAVLY